MADLSTEVVNGNTYSLKDTSARATANAVTVQEEYDRQQAANCYNGQSLITLLGASSADDCFAKLHQRASAANFAGLRVGDHIDVSAGIYGTRRFVIADFDPYYQMGDTAMGHHICFVDSAPVPIPSGDTHECVTGTNLKWNATNTNQGTEAENCPYLASGIHDWEINNFLAAFPTALKNVMIERREWLETRYASGQNLTASPGAAWKSLGKLWSLSEMEVYGTVVWGTPGYSVGISRQLEYFKNIKRQLSGGRVPWWLRSVSGSSASNVCYVNSNGYANYNSAAYALLRPRCGFLLG